MQSIDKHGISRGLLSPVQVLVYINASNLPSNTHQQQHTPHTTYGGTLSPPLPGAMDLPCHDDNYDLQQKLWPFTPAAASITCPVIKALGVCYKKTFQGQRLGALVTDLCPGSCAGFCRNGSSSSRRVNVSILTVDFYEKVRIGMENGGRGGEGGGGGEEGRV